eukprot:CAMPEP_0115599016 /NCGR_PEP_ID=MMETSP0272-20121206/14173_1 /TAXON_ID=71861 /ORGANISM="Scrippsiella trochoidea, Strain CCMP3099" /LENGTH=55 /DNA_ID=CAMNT_0003034451 /DNA_START=139 /DNA_END=303 /DNA_ORIENTATION=-
MPRYPPTVILDPCQRRRHSMENHARLKTNSQKSTPIGACNLAYKAEPPSRKTASM